MNRYLFAVLAIYLFSCGAFRENRAIRYTDMHDYEKLRWEDSMVLVMLGNDTVHTSTLKLNKGKYTMVFSARGTAAAGRLPQIIISLADFTIRDMEIAEGLNEYKLKFEIPKDVDAPLSFNFYNDFYNGKEDRNVYISFPFYINDF